MNQIHRTLFFALYQGLLLPLLMLVMQGLSFFNAKIREGMKLREPDSQGLLPWLDWFPNQKPIWIHCASMELEYAKPVITEIKARDPEQKILVTFFSPSVANAARRFPGIDFACPMPWDKPAAWKQFLEHHRPRALLIARTDTWPEMLRQTHRFGIPSLLFAATLSSESGRAKGFGRWMSRVVFGFLTQIFCVTDADRHVFESLGFGKNTRVAGDTRYDQVQARLASPKPLRDELFQGSDLPIFIAGSSWTEDESVLIPLAQALSAQVRFVFVPHEPTPSHLEELETRLRAAGLGTARYNQAQAWHQGDVLLVDQMGILAELYAQARFAFVGGSFKKTVHSVMEPLAAGCLTFVGPLHTNNREALEFKSIPLAPDANLTLVQPARDASDFISLLQKALIEFTEEDRERVRQEIRKRGGKSELVVRWAFENAQSRKP